MRTSPVLSGLVLCLAVLQGRAAGSEARASASAASASAAARLRLLRWPGKAAQGGAAALRLASVATHCDDSCQFSGDGNCDDGGPASKSELCELGTDCTDCGSRAPGAAPKAMRATEPSVVARKKGPAKALLPPVKAAAPKVTAKTTTTTTTTTAAAATTMPAKPANPANPANPAPGVSAPRNTPILPGTMLLGAAVLSWKEELDTNVAGHDLRACQANNGDIRGNPAELLKCKKECEDDSACVALVLGRWGTMLKTTNAGAKATVGFTLLKIENR